ncbi:MAG: glucokinase, partial [Pseudomonadota bacterium]
MILDESRRDGGVAPVAFPVLIADIGGTNVRFALLSDEHSALRSFPTIQTGDFSGFVEAVRATVLDTMSLMPQSLLIAIAGPLRDGILTLTNAHWEMDPPQIREALNLQSVITFNDFEALAMALPNLSEPQILKLGGGEPAGRRPRVVLGPGTGLGVAALVYSNRCYTPLPGEGGHMAFGPETARDYAIWPQLERVGGRVTAESILC